MANQTPTNTTKIARHFRVLLRTAKLFYPEGLSPNKRHVEYVEGEDELCIIHTRNGVASRLCIQKLTIDTIPVIQLSCTTPDQITIRIFTFNLDELRHSQLDYADGADCEIIGNTMALHHMIRNHALDDVMSHEAGLISF